MTTIRSRAQAFHPSSVFFYKLATKYIYDFYNFRILRSNSKMNDCIFSLNPMHSHQHIYLGEGSLHPNDHQYKTNALEFKKNSALAQQAYHIKKRTTYIDAESSRERNNAGFVIFLI